jgi:hypothetical protein
MARLRKRLALAPLLVIGVSVFGCSPADGGPTQGGATEQAAELVKSSKPVTLTPEQEKYKALAAGGGHSPAAGKANNLSKPTEDQTAAGQAVAAADAKATAGGDNK